MIEFPFSSLVGKPVEVKVVNPHYGTVYASVRAKSCSLVADDSVDFPSLVLYGGPDGNTIVAKIMESCGPGVRRPNITGGEVRARLNVRSRALTPVYCDGYFSPTTVYGLLLNGKFAVGRLDSEVQRLMMK